MVGYQDISGTEISFITKLKICYRHAQNFGDWINNCRGFWGSKKRHFLSLNMWQSPIGLTDLSTVSLGNIESNPLCHWGPCHLEVRNPLSTLGEETEGQQWQYTCFCGGSAYPHIHRGVHTCSIWPLCKDSKWACSPWKDRDISVLPLYFSVSSSTSSSPFSF